MAKTNSFGFESRIILVSLVSFLLVFLFYKLVLYFTSSNYFSVLDMKQVFPSLLYGIRFDINFIAVFLFPLFIILSFPIRNRIFIKTISFLICTIFLAMSLFLAADIVFFSLFNNHIGVEILTSLTHFGLFAQLAFSTYLNRIRENSLYFPNFYSSGTRSLLGCGSTLFSMPYIWGVPTLNNGLAAKNLSRMAEIFKKGTPGSGNHSP